MPIDLRSLRPAALVKALSRQLRSSRWRGVCRGAVLSVQRSKLRIAVLEFVAFSLPWAGGLWVYNQHSTWPSWVAVVLPVSSGILGGILLGGLPLALVSFYEHKRIEIGRRTCLRVVEVLNELPRIEPDVLTGKPTQLLPKVVESIRNCESSLYLLTQNGSYLVADWWIERCKPESKADLEPLAAIAGELRQALEACPGEVHILFPDLRAKAVQDHFKRREERLGLGAGSLTRITEEAIKWAGTVMSEHREKSGRGASRLYFMETAPGFRIVASATWAYFQRFPEGELASLQDIEAIGRAEGFAVAVRALQASLRGMTDLLDHVVGPVPSRKLSY